MEPPGGTDIDRMEWLDDMPGPTAELDPDNTRLRAEGVPGQTLYGLQTGVSNTIAKELESSSIQSNGVSHMSSGVASSDFIAWSMRKPPCRYGRGCSHTSTYHRTRYSHPGDATDARQGRSRLGVASSCSNASSLSCAVETGTRRSCSGSTKGGNGVAGTIAVPVINGAICETALSGFMCNECGMDFGTVKELQLHMVRKTAWSNQGLIGCRVSCLVDNREWHEGLVTQVTEEVELLCLAMHWE